MKPIVISDRLAKLALANGFTVSYDETFGQLRVDRAGTNQPMRAVFFADSPITIDGFLTRHATRTLDDRELVIEVLRGAYSGMLNEKQEWAVYCEGDGFGYCLPEVLEQINDGWDWSHIRDSSPAGYARMAALIRTYRPDEFKPPSFADVRLSETMLRLLKQVAEDEGQYKGVSSSFKRTLFSLAGRGLVKGIHQGIALSIEEGAQTVHVALTAEGRALLPSSPPPTPKRPRRAATRAP